MCKTVLLAGFVVLCAGFMQAEEAESGDIVVAKIRLVTPHYEYEWTAMGGEPVVAADSGTGEETMATADSGAAGKMAAAADAGVTDSPVAEAAAVADAGIQPSAVFSWTALYPGREMTLAEFECEVLRTERRLVDSGLFYLVSVHVVPPRRKPLERTVVITVSDGFLNRFSGGNAYAMYGRKALGGNRAALYVYAGWNLFGMEAVHENFGNRGFILEGEAFSHDFFPSVFEVDDAELRNDFAVRAGKFFSPDVSITVGPGLVTTAEAYDGKHSLYPFGEAVLRIKRFGFVPLEAEWSLESSAAFFPFDEFWKVESVGSVSTVVVEDVFGRDRRDQCIELYLSGAGGWMPEDAPAELAFRLYDAESRTVRSGYSDRELTFSSFLFASAEIRLDIGSFAFLPGFSAVPQVFLFTDAAFPAPGPEWDGTVLDAYGAGLRLKFPSPVFMDAACSWGINHDGAWRVVFFVQTKK